MRHVAFVVHLRTSYGGRHFLEVLVIVVERISVGTGVVQDDRFLRVHASDFESCALLDFEIDRLDEIRHIPVVVAVDVPTEMLQYLPTEVKYFHYISVLVINT